MIKYLVLTAVVLGVVFSGIAFSTGPYGIDIFENPPTEDEANKGPSSEWAYDLEVALAPNPVTVRIDNYKMSEDNFAIWQAPNFAVTITHVAVRCHGQCTTPAIITFEDGGGTALTHDTIIIQDDDSVAVAYKAVTAGGGLIAGELLRIDNSQTSQVPETDEYLPSFIWTRD